PGSTCLGGATPRRDDLSRTGSPFPFFEQVGQRILKTRQNLLAVQNGLRAQQPTLRFGGIFNGRGHVAKVVRLRQGVDRQWSSRTPPSGRYGRRVARHILENLGDDVVGG